MVNDIKNFKDFNAKAYGLRKYIANLVYSKSSFINWMFPPSDDKKELIKNINVLANANGGYGDTGIMLDRDFVDLYGNASLNGEFHNIGVLHDEKHRINLCIEYAERKDSELQIIEKAFDDHFKDMRDSYVGSVIKSMREFIDLKHVYFKSIMDKIERMIQESFELDCMDALERFEYEKRKARHGDVIDVEFEDVALLKGVRGESCRYQIQ